jgi:hypothetical protein
MEDLLFGLTPAEFWVWNYLIYLARRQGSNHVILPRPGEDIKAEKVFGRKHIKNLIKRLKSKRHLTHIIFPRSKLNRIEVFLPVSVIGELQFPNKGKGLMEFPKSRERGNCNSPMTTLENKSSPISSEDQRTLPGSALGQLELNEKIKMLLKQKQGQLKKELQAMGPRDLVEVERVLKRVCRYEPKGKKLSLQAKVYAVVRFLQEGEAITKPQAWIDTVARQGQRDFEEARSWSGDSSGSVGRSQFPGRYAEG